MNRQILSKYDSSKVLYQAEAESFAALILAAIKSGANLRGANLSGANLSGADLSGADLSGADLSGADLYGANLRGANLYGANLYGANLRGADLRGADLYGADLSGADLYGADLYGAKNAELVWAQTSIVPDHGPLFGWKICENNVLVRLFIPSKARRSNATGRKCRAERAKVLEVIGAEIGISKHDSTFTYKTGQWVRADKWDENRWEECSGGIHFFLTRIEAENYK
jgi:hypothetical protein